MVQHHQIEEALEKIVENITNKNQVREDQWEELSKLIQVDYSQFQQPQQLGVGIAQVNDLINQNTNSKEVNRLEQIVAFYGQINSIYEYMLRKKKKLRNGLILWDYFRNMIITSKGMLVIFILSYLTQNANDSGQSFQSQNEQQKCNDNWSQIEYSSSQNYSDLSDAKSQVSVEEDWAHVFNKLYSSISDDGQLFENIVYVLGLKQKKTEVVLRKFVWVQDKKRQNYKNSYRLIYSHLMEREYKQAFYCLKKFIQSLQNSVKDGKANQQTCPRQYIHSIIDYCLQSHHYVQAYQLIHIPQNFTEWTEIGKLKKGAILLGFEEYQAAESVFKSMDRSKLTQEERLQLVVGLGHVYRGLRQYGQALKKYELAMKMVQRSNNLKFKQTKKIYQKGNSDYLMALFGIAVVCFEQKFFKPAIYYLNQILFLMRAKKGQLWVETYMYLSKISLYLVNLQEFLRLADKVNSMVSFDQQDVHPIVFKNYFLSILKQIEEAKIAIKPQYLPNDDLFSIHLSQDLSVLDLNAATFQSMKQNLALIEKKLKGISKSELQYGKMQMEGKNYWTAIYAFKNVKDVMKVIVNENEQVQNMVFCFVMLKERFRGFLQIERMNGKFQADERLLEMFQNVTLIKEFQKDPQKLVNILNKIYSNSIAVMFKIAEAYIKLKRNSLAIERLQQIQKKIQKKKLISEQKILGQKYIEAGEVTLGASLLGNGLKIQSDQIQMLILLRTIKNNPTIDLQPFRYFVDIKYEGKVVQIYRLLGELNCRQKNYMMALQNYSLLTDYEESVYVYERLVFLYEMLGQHIQDNKKMQLKLITKILKLRQASYFQSNKDYLDNLKQMAVVLQKAISLQRVIFINFRLSHSSNGRCLVFSYDQLLQKKNISHLSTTQRLQIQYRLGLLYLQLNLLQLVKQMIIQILPNDSQGKYYLHLLLKLYTKQNGTSQQIGKQKIEKYLAEQCLKKKSQKDNNMSEKWTTLKYLLLGDYDLSVAQFIQRFQKCRFSKKKTGQLLTLFNELVRAYKKYNKQQVLLKLFVGIVQLELKNAQINQSINYFYTVNEEDMGQLKRMNKEMMALSTEIRGYLLEKMKLLVKGAPQKLKSKLRAIMDGEQTETGSL